MICFRDPHADIWRGGAAQRQSSAVLVAVLITAMVGAACCARASAAEKDKLDIWLDKLDERTSVREINEFAPELSRRMMEATELSFETKSTTLHRLLELNELATKLRRRAAAHRGNEIAATKALDSHARAVKQQLNRVTQLYNERLPGGDTLAYHFVKLHYYLATATIAQSGSDRKTAEAELKKAIHAANHLIVSAKTADRLLAWGTVDALEAMRLRRHCYVALAELTSDDADRTKAIQFAKEYSVGLAEEHAKSQKIQQKLPLLFSETPIDRFFRWGKETEASSVIARLNRDRKGEREAWKSFLEKADKQDFLKSLRNVYESGALRWSRYGNGVDMYWLARIRIAELDDDDRAASKACARRAAAHLVIWKQMVASFSRVGFGHGVDREDALLAATHYCLARIDAAMAAKRLEKPPK